MSLTAYVLITLNDARSVCTPQLSRSIVAARNLAVTFLQANKDDVTFRKPYALSLLTYALSLRDPTTAFAREMNTRLDFCKVGFFKSAFLQVVVLDLKAKINKNDCLKVDEKLVIIIAEI